MTLREQIAASIGRWALEQPIEHNVEEAREPRFTVPAEPPEPDPGEIDIARVHITAWVAAPCYESEILDFEVCTVAQVNFAVKNTSAQFQDIPMEYVPTIPQLGRDFASYVAFSSWLPETDKVVQVVDATAIGGGTFAAYVQTPFNQQSILMNLVGGLAGGATGLHWRQRPAYVARADNTRRCPVMSSKSLGLEWSHGGVKSYGPPLGRLPEPAMSTPAMAANPKSHRTPKA